MYSITKNIKILSFSMMLIGLLALAYGFYSAPHSLEEAKEIEEPFGIWGGLNEVERKRNLIFS